VIVSENESLKDKLRIKETVLIVPIEDGLRTRYTQEVEIDLKKFPLSGSCEKILLKAWEARGQEGRQVDVALIKEALRGGGGGGGGSDGAGAADRALGGGGALGGSGASVAGGGSPAAGRSPALASGAQAGAGGGSNLAGALDHGPTASQGVAAVVPPVAMGAAVWAVAFVAFLFLVDMSTQARALGTALVIILATAHLKIFSSSSPSSPPPTSTSTSTSAPPSSSPPPSPPRRAPQPDPVAEAGASSESVPSSADLANTAAGGGASVSEDDEEGALAAAAEVDHDDLSSENPGDDDGVGVAGGIVSASASAPAAVGARASSVMSASLASQEDAPASPLFGSLALSGPCFLAIDFRISIALHPAGASWDKPILIIDSRRRGGDGHWRSALRGVADFEALHKVVKKLSKGAVPRLPKFSGDVDVLRLSLTYYLKMLLVSEAPRPVDEAIRSFFSAASSQHMRPDWSRANTSRAQAAALGRRAGAPGEVVREGSLCQALTRSEWAEQWAVLFRGHLCMFDRASERMLCSVPLAEVETVRILEERPCGAPFGVLVVDCVSYSVYLLADTDASAQEWVHAIESALYGEMDEEDVIASTIALTSPSLQALMQPASSQPAAASSSGLAAVSWATTPMAALPGRVVLNRRRLLWAPDRAHSWCGPEPDPAPAAPGAVSPGDVAGGDGDGADGAVEVSARLLESALRLYHTTCNVKHEAKEVTEAMLQEYVDFALATSQLQLVSPADLGHAARLSFFLNVYHVLVLHIWLELLFVRAFFHGTCALDTLMEHGQLPKDKYFRDICLDVAGYTFSLIDIEFGLIRAPLAEAPRQLTSELPIPKPASLREDPRFTLLALAEREPRVNFALANGLKSSQRTIAVYRTAKVDAQLDAAAERYCETQGVLYHPDRRLFVPSVLAWHSADFAHGSRLSVALPIRIARAVQAYLPDMGQRRRLADDIAQGNAIRLLEQPEELSLHGVFFPA
jgi:hypothetical protein